MGTSGGGETLARLVAMHLDPSRFEAMLCVTRWEPLPENERALAELREAGVSFLGLERGSRFQIGPWRRLVARAREWGADVLHAHKFGSNVWGALLAPRIPVRVFVAHEHTWSYVGQPHRRFLDRNLIARRADAFVAVSREDQRRMIEIERVPAAKTRFIANGIPDLAPPDSGRDVRGELGLAPGAPVVGVVAIPRPQKALDVLVRAAARLREAVPELAVLVVGGTEGPATAEEERLRGLVGELGLGETVRFLGGRSDVPELLRAFDVAALSSDFEGSPLSVMEYMAASRPVVATRVGGVPDLVEEGVTGLLVEPQEPEALAAALLELLRDPDRAARMGVAGRERQQREFSIEATARRIGDLYDELWTAGKGGAEREN
jgi:glycosyltransferase involved in cell wall biosynthesis